ncbi:MAG: hypothetical protein WKF29_06085 [Thermoleophilaceae bacterium]
MSFLAGLRSLVLGETWVVPIGVAMLLGGAALGEGVADSLWHDGGAVLLTAGAVIVVLVSVASGARRR